MPVFSHNLGPFLIRGPVIPPMVFDALLDSGGPIGPHYDLNGSAAHSELLR